MKIKVFQSYFDPSQRAFVDPLFTPFDNTANKEPHLREYHIFQRLTTEGHTDGLDLWGMVGPRWQEKLHFTSQDLFDNIENNPGYDVYIFNHAQMLAALTHNVWELSDRYHPGITDVAKELLTRMGHCDVTTRFMTESVVCYCSYFVATNEFWADYLKFLEKAKYILDNLEDGPVKDAYQASANYRRDPQLTLFPFITERLFSTFLSLNPTYQVYHRPYDYSKHSNLSASAVDVLTVINKLKTVTDSCDNHEVQQQLYNSWNQLRRFLIKKHPGIMRNPD
jgi:hypothetical protein